MNDYKIAFRAACADLGAVSTLLGFESYPGIDQILKAITNLIVESRPAPEATPESAEKKEHRPGCEALGGYGHGIGPCDCGADAAPQPASEQQAASGLSDDALECLEDVVSHHESIMSSLAAMRNSAMNRGDSEASSRWVSEIEAVRRMKSQAERALLVAKGNGHA
jgi:hypothetical protein